MDQSVAFRLLDLNRQFYQTFALQFSQTRQRLQPGVIKIINRIPMDANILDIGCGNGELWHVLRRAGFVGNYIGLDSSNDLLQIARKKTADVPSQKPTFIHADLSFADWEKSLGFHIPDKFDFILAFAVLHHLPGESLRTGIIQNIAKLLSNQGQFIHSEWQFFNSPKYRSRIQGWERIGLSKDQLDEGDHLLDWRQGGSGLRYVHLFSEQELSTLAAQGNFHITETFYSDGQSGNLGIYQTWEKT